MHTHTDTHTHPAARTSLAQRPPLAWWLQAHQGGLPPPRCLPACSHLCTTMSGIFLSAQLGGGGGGAWGYEHCLHLGLSQRQARQAAPTPRWRVEREGLGPQAAQIPGRGQHQGSQTGTHTNKAAAQALPGSTATRRGRAGLGTLPVLSRACRGVGQCPTGHGWAPMAPSDI